MLHTFISSCLCSYFLYAGNNIFLKKYLVKKYLLCNKVLEIHWFCVKPVWQVLMLLVVRGRHALKRILSVLHTEKAE